MINKILYDRNKYCRVGCKKCVLWIEKYSFLIIKLNRKKISRGEHRSVEKELQPQSTHPVRDASLRDAGKYQPYFSTERCNPTDCSLRISKIERKFFKNNTNFLQPTRRDNTLITVGFKP